jgi:hypothetical protein
VEGELIDGKIPELVRSGRESHTFLCIFVAAVVAKPHIIALLNQLEWQTPLLVGQGNPHLTAHEKAVVEVNHFLAESAGTLIDSHALFTLPICQPVESQKISISSLDDMLLSFVPEKRTYLSEIRCLCNRGRKNLLLCSFFARFGGDKFVED